MWNPKLDRSTVSNLSSFVRYQHDGESVKSFVLGVVMPTILIIIMIALRSIFLKLRSIITTIVITLRSIINAIHIFSI